MLFILGENDIKEILEQFTSIDKNLVGIESWNSETQSINIKISIEALSEIAKKTIGKKINIKSAKILGAKDPNFICAIDIDMNDPLVVNEPKQEEPVEAQESVEHEPEEQQNDQAEEETINKKQKRKKIKKVGDIELEEDFV